MSNAEDIVRARQEAERRTRAASQAARGRHITAEDTKQSAERISRGLRFARRALRVLAVAG